MRPETPVLLIIFNRPEMAMAVMKALQLAKPKYLLVAADAPRAAKPGEAVLCAKTREVVSGMINWPCEVHWKCPDNNLGCGHGPATAITWALEMFEEVVILEDDCVPHPGFFTFTSEMLERYRYEPQVMLVSGVNVLRGRYALPYSYGFSRYSLTWGWATWRRAWKYFDFDIKVWPAMRDVDALFDILGNRREAEYWTRNFETIRNGRLDAWDYQLHVLMWARGSYALYPASNLITNIGVQGTHFSEPRPMHNVPVAPLASPLRHPPIIYRDVKADALIRRTWYLPSISDRICKRLRKGFSGMRALANRSSVAPSTNALREDSVS